jgi:hypothetical protein
MIGLLRGKESSALFNKCSLEMKWDFAAFTETIVQEFEENKVSKAIISKTS